MILLIDSYDSFANNLKRLIERATGKEVLIVQNNSFPEEDFENVVKRMIETFEYIVIGPGPGSPSVASDVGIIRYMINYMKVQPDHSMPLLGVCLGLQCICYEFGNEVTKLDHVRHGQVFSVIPCVHEGRNDLFLEDSGNGKLQEDIACVRYHSLHVDVQKLNNEMIPLAYCDDINKNSDPVKILMAARHKTYPFYGVQYHPESICSGNGETLIRNFDNIAKIWNINNRFSQNIRGNLSFLDNIRKLQTHEAAISKLENPNGCAHITIKELFQDGTLKPDPITVCDYLYKNSIKFLFLNSGADPGRWSIVGLPIVGVSEVITHSTDTPYCIKLSNFDSDRSQEETLSSGETLWTFLTKRMSSIKIRKSELLAYQTEHFYFQQFPFIGGYMGLFSYEEGQYVDTSHASFCESSTPDSKLVMIERFLVHDKLNSRWFIGSIIPDDSNWVSEFASDLRNAYRSDSMSLDKNSIPSSIRDFVTSQNGIAVEGPSKDIYLQQFKLCQDHLTSGNSYELCLTTQLKIEVENIVDPWEMYKVLAIKANPSSHSCYYNFDDLILLSTSPERFLSWKYDSDDKYKVEYKPIKGTVAKRSDVSLEIAEEILTSPKERGENLMIVDLIRHDLFKYAHDVEVSSLMQIEENETVYSLVSAINGTLDSSRYSALDILRTSLPPGSMTGAPKKRSVELLQKIEDMQPNTKLGYRRGVYSGVAGYWSITDEADWCVIIRSLFHYKNDKENTSSKSVWRAGAGGAITVLSNPESEWEEVCIKYNSVLKAFK